MAKKSFIPMVIAFLLGAFALASAIPQDDASDRKVVKTQCLACHGPFDKLAAETADYKAPSGETVTPHQYIPHAEKKDIPECVECHIPHPIPFESKDQVVIPDNIDFCYDSCHHMRNLQPCSACHQ
jgi:hypothetical protein